MNISTFLGVNNFADPTRLKPGELAAATDVDIGARNDIQLRRGRTLIKAGQASSPFLTSFGLLALVDNDLLLLDAAGNVLRTVYNTLGYTRVWYDHLPDGRVAFSNGLINGLCTASATTTWGVPTPPDTGNAVAGPTPVMTTYVRLSDGLEGAPRYGDYTIDTTSSINDMPALASHKINVYFAPYGDEFFLAGSTTTDSFLSLGGQLGVPFVARGLGAPPVGILLHSWTSHVLIADGSTLWATRPMQPELCDLTKDFVQFPDPITMVWGTNEGVFVGTTKNMHFLRGYEVGKWVAQSVAAGYVALGSGVEIDLQYLSDKIAPSGIRQGALCLVDGVLALVFGNGQIIALTKDVYRNAAAEVWASTRMLNGALQYIAAPV